MATTNTANADEPKPKARRTTPLNQSDVPAYPLSEALRVAEAIRISSRRKRPHRSTSRSR